MLWGLSAREYRALEQVWKMERDRQQHALAVLRADIHNTAGKSFERVIQPDEFLPGKSIKTIEDRARELMEQGYAPAAAVAMAHSTQDREERSNIIQTTMDGARIRAKKKGRRVKTG